MAGAQSKRIFVASSGLVAGPFSMETALEHMRTCGLDRALAVDENLVVFAVLRPDDEDSPRIDDLDARNDAILARLNREALVA